MFSGCKDSQTSADVKDTTAFGIAGGPGGAGGACTNSMIQALQRDGSPTWAGLLNNMRMILASSGYTQVPMLSTSKNQQLDTKFSVTHEMPGESSQRRAALVGINYVGSKYQLAGCHNDVTTMQNYLKTQGFAAGNMRVLLDDGRHDMPTHANIQAAMKWLVAGAKSGDSLFFHYSGHGTSLDDDDGDEADGKDEALVPVDFQKSGMLRDDEILTILVMSLPEGVRLTCVFDCCHSGTIMDLPYVFRADNEASFDNPVMMLNSDFKVDMVINIATNLGIAALRFGDSCLGCVCTGVGKIAADIMLYIVGPPAPGSAPASASQ